MRIGEEKGRGWGKTLELGRQTLTEATTTTMKPAAGNENKNKQTSIIFTLSLLKGTARVAFNRFVHLKFYYISDLRFIFILCLEL